MHSLRWLALSLVVAAGVITLVGSGGGISIGIGFPPCPDEICFPPPPAGPSASVRPSHATAQVGSAVSFVAGTANLDGTLSYQWRRSTDGGASFVDIPGATAATLTLPAVNLADDRTTLLVQVRSSGGGSVSASAQLAVSSAPGVRFDDATFAAPDWVVLSDPGQLPFAALDEALAAGGNPGAFRRMTYTIPGGAGTARRLYLKPAARYDPAALGAVYVIDYAEDCQAVNPNPLTSVETGLVIEQGARRYVWHNPTPCASTNWVAGIGRGSLAARDFVLVAGPACSAGESCPDFGAGAPPLAFGHRRIVFGVAGNVIGHGIDNWRVTVWRR